MLKDRDEFLLQIMAKLDDFDDDAFAAFAKSVAPLLGNRGRSSEYLFLFRTRHLTARTLVDFMETAFYAANPNATRH